ncbi:tryptophan-rich sensory protein [Pedobacter jejuensis]|uniref:Tryptophan-rich sensory protein n=1 Tax=Pedobacter jejuensis TaxID=1268550 RepID=A0A3N0C244_9SPHI|nr:tryptophan-rich sensory protein [Pedobacter jejuensis]RNL56138.1 tryptophan-rich sensory protein [Pedobacter jejuensis]
MDSSKKILPFANGLALVLTILVNYLSNTGLLNGNTMKTVSDRYFNYFTPAGYAFSIWGIIYLGLLAFVLYTGINGKKDPVKSDVVAKIGWWFVLSCLANCLWVVAWLYDYTGISVVIMAVILFSLLKIIVNTRMELDAHPLKEYLFIYWPFALYSGWITVAFIANIAAYLTKIDWQGWGISSVTWAIIMICIAGLVNVIMVYTRNLREFAAVGIWALIAISVSNNNDPAQVSIVYTCYAVSAIIFGFIIHSGLKNRKNSIDSM